MESSSKIALAIVAAAALLLVGFIGYREFERQRDISDAQAALASIGEQGKQLSAQFQQQSVVDQEQTREAAAMQWDRRLLEGKQRCIGGVVVLVDGSSYTQLGTVGDPVRCSGRYADRPIR
ncbi:hypothetical protein [Dyella sp. S184]|uniref:hypothetical protein n=1 Tax=Dyella sp. S184 TaxID=1641862 RepID=UPI00131CD9F8|nr:hypothetical protein [Dyella sp. S184]